VLYSRKRVAAEVLEQEMPGAGAEAAPLVERAQAKVEPG
jgi:hypothetical protein